MDVDGSVFVLLRLECLGLVIEEELLSNVVELLGLQHKVSSTSNFNCSSASHSSDDVEWSSDVESEFALQSCCLHVELFVGVENLPSLMSLTGLFVDTTCLSFLVSGSAYFKDSSFDVHKHLGLVSEDLEPVTVGAPYVHLWSITVVLDAQGLSVGDTLDGSAGVVKGPLLSFGLLSCLDDTVVSNKIDVSTA